MKSLRNNMLTKIAGVIILMAALYVQFSQKQWNYDGVIIAADARGYYGYLPALFVHDDLLLENPENFAGDLAYETTTEGRNYIKYTCGMAMVYSPFFFVAHALAEPLGAPADGYSYPYKFALAMSAIVFLLIALIFLSKLSLLYFKDSVVSITILALFAGTNALQYYSFTMTQAHGYSLALIAVFLYYTVRWLSEPQLKWAIWIGLTAGLFVLIRPIDVLFLLALPLIGVASLSQLKKRFGLFWNRRGQVAVMLMGFVIVLIPQLLYFKLISGSFLFFSYTGESFFFGSPHLFDSLFSYRNGWLVYSPIMILSLAGFFLLRRQKEQFILFILPVSILYIYIIASWWCWWYSGFGNRAYVNLYPLLAIPLAASIQFLLSKKWPIRVLFKLIVLAAVTLSSYQAYQYSVGMIHWGSMTKEAYWDVFLQSQSSPFFETYLEHPVKNEQMEGRDIVQKEKEEVVYTFQYSFENQKESETIFSKSTYVTGRDAFVGQGAIQLENGQDATIGKEVSLVDIDALHISVWAKNPPRGLQIAISENGNAPYTNTSEFSRMTDGEWTKIEMLYRIPIDLELDKLQVQIWNPWKEKVVIDDFVIEGVQMSVEQFER